VICAGEEELGAVCLKLLESIGVDAGAVADDDRAFADADAADEVMNSGCEAAGTNEEGL
jgi:hypothetical protein